MKVMFVCAGGMSTAMTAKKLQEVADKNDVEMTVKAFGTSDYLKELKKDNYDVLLVAPQIRHRFDVIKESANKFDGLVVEKIPPNMYAPMEPIVKKLFNFIMEKVNNK
ncbi:PTS sugar transporter subunit IIB [Clostridium sp. D2Q-14]|uniref:PTS sugar transporter subunit IIB n=1 Tax=Anaeromonas gelatinilytica TaxID=2683194 RepID=UPI00193BC644|nr:PTS sugar transporter subunit IIB [Anaeromonas gelatinilytica]MBS4536718.1 PTS sugar transporter subunit IIB [Anaeromonas gelatinilytica]